LEPAKQQAFETIVWRNRLQLHRLDPSYFPQEFYLMGGLYECGPDHFGLPVLCIRAKCIRKAHLIDRLLSQFLAFRLHSIERRLNALESWTLLFDCCNIGFANVNLDLIRFLMDLLRVRFPLSLRYALVLEVPFLLNAVQKLVMAMLPEDNKRLVRFVNRRQLTCYVPKERLPLYLDGNETLDISCVPPQCTRRLLSLCVDQFDLCEAEVRRQCRPYLDMLAEMPTFAAPTDRNHNDIETTDVKGSSAFGQPNEISAVASRSELTQ
jgi:hypothetical protein